MKTALRILKYIFLILLVIGFFISLPFLWILYVIVSGGNVNIENETGRALSGVVLFERGDSFQRAPFDFLPSDSYKKIKVPDLFQEGYIRVRVTEGEQTASGEVYVDSLYSFFTNVDATVRRDSQGRVTLDIIQK